jgi:hypothetical protein
MKALRLGGPSRCVVTEWSRVTAARPLTALARLACLVDNRGNDAGRLLVQLGQRVLIGVARDRGLRVPDAFGHDLQWHPARRDAVA